MDSSKLLQSGPRVRIEERTIIRTANMNSFQLQPDSNLLSGVASLRAETYHRGAVEEPSCENLCWIVISDIGGQGRARS
jgi:hypothetical protein